MLSRVAEGFTISRVAGATSAAIAGFSYTAMSLFGSTALKYPWLRYLCSADSAMVNGGLFFLTGSRFPGIIKENPRLLALLPIVPFAAAPLYTSTFDSMQSIIWDNESFDVLCAGLMFGLRMLLTVNSIYYFPKVLTEKLQAIKQNYDEGQYLGAASHSLVLLCAMLLSVSYTFYQHLGISKAFEDIIALFSNTAASSFGGSLAALVSCELTGSVFNFFLNSDYISNGLDALLELARLTFSHETWDALKALEFNQHAKEMLLRTIGLVLAAGSGAPAVSTTQIAATGPTKTLLDNLSIKVEISYAAGTLMNLASLTQNFQQMGLLKNEAEKAQTAESTLLINAGEGHSADAATSKGYCARFAGMFYDCSFLREQEISASAQP